MVSGDGHLARHFGQARRLSYQPSVREHYLFSMSVSVRNPGILYNTVTPDLIRGPFLFNRSVT
jgi:hypothetical protein